MEVEARRVSECATTLSFASREETLDASAELISAVYDLCKLRGISPTEIHYRAASPKKQRLRKEKVDSSDSAAVGVAASAPAFAVPWFWMLVVVCGVLVAHCAERYRRVGAYVAGIQQMDRKGRVSALVGPLEVVPFGVFDGDYVVRLLRALDSEGRAEYLALYESGAAFALAGSYTALFIALRSRRRRRGAFAPPLALCLLVGVADVVSNVCHWKALAAFPTAPPPPATHSGSTLTEGAVGLTYTLPPLSGRLGPKAELVKWAAACLLGNAFLVPALLGL